MDGYRSGLGASDAVLLRTALRYWLDEPDRGRTAWKPLRQGESGDPAEFELDPGLYEELEREAERQEAAPESVALHALVYFMADLDTGRAGARLGTALKQDDAEAD
jgi:hypothetical protein